jgi:hypothetical protein
MSTLFAVPPWQTTAADLEVAVERCFAGESMRQVSETSGVDRKRLSATLKSRGFQARVGRKTVLPQDQVDLLRPEAEKLFKSGRSHSQIANDLGVPMGVVATWCRGLDRGDDAGSELSPRQAAATSGLTKEAIMAAIKDGRLPAQLGERSASHGRTGPKTLYLIERDDLDQFVTSLTECRYEGCTEVGTTSAGYCGRTHQAAHQNNLAKVMAAGQEAVSDYESEHGLMTGKNAAATLKVAESVLTWYEKNGSLVPVERRLDLIPGRGGVKLYRSADVRRARRELLDRVAQGRSAPTPGAPIGPLAKKRWTGRLNGHRGASSGHLGREAGIEVGHTNIGRPADLSPQQCVEILELRREGLGTRRIAERVLGDQKYFMRVVRFLNR